MLLNDHNFVHWKQRLMVYLSARNVLQAIKDEKPTGDKEEDLAKIEAWERKNSEAKHIILSALRDEHLSLINIEDDASQILKDIERIYGASTQNSYRHLLDKLLKLKMNSREQFTEHVKSFSEIVQRIALTPEALNEVTKVTFLLASLGPAFSSFRSLMDHTKDLTFNELISHLREECRESLDSQERNSRRSDCNYASKQFKKAKEITCFNCQRRGHIAKDCKSPKVNKPRPFKPEGDKRGKHECNMLLQERSLAVQNYENVHNKWYLDSGASSHFCFNEKYFDELNDEESEIQIPDGRILKSKGAGSVHLEFNVDNEPFRTRVSNVLFVPELNCNLLSVSTFEKKGFKVTFENGQCNVTKHGEVYIQGKLINNVYEVDLSESQSAKVDTRKTVIDCSKESEWTQELIHFPSVTPQSTNLPSSVIAPPTGDAPEDAEDQNPGGSRDEEDPEGDMPALEDDEEADAVQEPEPEVRRSSRTNRGVPPVRLSYLAGSASPQEPSTWEEIQRMPTAEASLWKKAAQEEMDALHQNKTWTLTELPPGKKAIGCKWVFKVKKGSEGEVQRYKARLVAQGFSQKYGEDYDETFAPTVRYSSVRMLLSIAASKQMDVRHIDVSTAFLHGEITEQIYMKQPKGFIKPNEAHLVCKLEKGLYGLRQAARAWNQKLHSMLVQLGYKQGNADKCLYSKSSNGQFSYILAFVDDLIIATSNNRDYVQIVKHLSKEVGVKELGDVKYYLGIQVEREEDGSFLLSQRQKINELIECMQLQDANTVATPMATDFLKNQQDSKLLPDNSEYRSVIGKLLYLVTTCRPDIANAVGILSRKVSSPTEHDWAGVKRVVRYLKGTVNCKLRLPAVSDPKLVGYTDADWAGDNADYKSTSGHVFMFGDGPVVWGSYKQNCVALSSTEAEYISASESCREIAWLDELIKDFGLVRKEPVSLLEDNQSCIKLTQSEKFLARTKHIGVRYHYIRQAVQDGLVELSYCCTNEMAADILTKPLPRESFQNLRVKLGLWVVE